MGKSKKAAVAEKPATEPAIKKKKSKKLPIIITSIIGGVLLLAGIGFAIWWFAYYNSDKKILNDAFYNFLNMTEGTSTMKLTFKIEGVTVEANIKTVETKDAAQFDIEAKITFVGDVSANLVVVKSGDIYIRIGNLDGILSMVDETGALGDFSDYLSILSDEWIKISKAEVEMMMSQVETTSTGDLEQCMANLNDISTKKSTQKEILDAITSTEVLTAERVDKDEDGIKFELSINISKALEFVKVLMDMEIYQVASDCVYLLGTDLELPEISDLEQIDSNWYKADGAGQAFDQFISNTTTYFWIKNRQPARMLSNTNMSESDIEVTEDIMLKIGDASVTIPSDSISLSELIMQLMPDGLTGLDMAL
jgi:flagellar basal body-associated protein FliL